MYHIWPIQVYLHPILAQVAEYEATTFSIFYNNSLFLALVIIASFYVLNGTSAHVNYLLSIGLSSGLIALLSTGTQS